MWKFMTRIYAGEARRTHNSNLIFIPLFSSSEVRSEGGGSEVVFKGLVVSCQTGNARYRRAGWAQAEKGQGFRGRGR
jgi:hypothetical protein